MRLHEHSVEIVNKEFRKGKGVQAVLDLKVHAKHNRLRIVTLERNLKEAVAVETSDELKQWATVLADGVIFDISRPEGRVSDTTVIYATSTRRYVRVTIPEWTDPPALESVWRKPWVLNVILGIAVAVMAFITYRFARKATSPAA